MSSLFIVKLIIAGIGVAIAMVNLVKYIETKDKIKLRRAAIFFFGMWVVLILIKAFEVWFNIQ